MDLDVDLALAVVLDAVVVAVVHLDELGASRSTTATTSADHDHVHDHDHDHDHVTWTWMIGPTVRHQFAGRATIKAFRHISLRVPQPGRTGSVSFEVSYSQVTWMRVVGVSAGRSRKK